MVAVKGIGLGFVIAPLVEGERRIGDDDVEFHQAVALDEAGVSQRIAPLDAEVVHAVEEHVHPAECVGGAIHFLAEEREVAVVRLTADLDEQGAGAAGGVTDRVPLFRREQHGQQLGDLTGRIKLTGLFPGVRGETLQQVFIDVADHVLLTDHGGPEIELRRGKVFKKKLELGVPVAGLAEL